MPDNESDDERKRKRKKDKKKKKKQAKAKAKASVNVEVNIGGAGTGGGKGRGGGGKGRGGGGGGYGRYNPFLDLLRAQQRMMMAQPVPAAAIAPQHPSQQRDKSIWEVSYGMSGGRPSAPPAPPSEAASVAGGPVPTATMGQAPPSDTGSPSIRSVASDRGPGRQPAPSAPPLPPGVVSALPMTDVAGPPAVRLNAAPANLSMLRPVDVASASYVNPAVAAGTVQATNQQAQLTAMQDATQAAAANAVALADDLDWALRVSTAPPGPIRRTPESRYSRTQPY